jgi:hypothetical protein
VPARRPAAPFWLVVGIRSAFWLATLVALIWAPLRSGFPTWSAYGRRSDFVFGAFAQWDSNWFLGIAAHGYTVPQATSFFPLYPLVVRAFAAVIGSHLVAGVVVSLACAGLAGIALERIARIYAGGRVPHDSVLFLALYPAAFVFTAVYSDALFVALAAWCWLLAQRRRVLPAALLAAAAVLTRPTGLALLPALVLLLRPRGATAREAARLAPLLLVPAPLVGYAIYLHSRFHDAFAFAHSEGNFWLRHVPSTGPFEGAWVALRSGEQGLAEILRHLPAHSGAPQGFGKPLEWATWNVVQLLLVLGACYLTWVCWRRLDRATAVYSAATIVLFLSAPADVVPLVSVPRFLLGDFPLFVALALLAAERPWLRTSVVSCFSALGLAAAVAFARGVWIS